MPEDKSIRANVQLLRYNFETHQLNKLNWILGNATLADALNKRDSALSETFVTPVRVSPCYEWCQDEISEGSRAAVL